MATQKTELALNWIYNPAKKEFKQITTLKKGVQVYTIRLGQRNPNLAYFNFTDYSVEIYPCEQFTNSTGFNVVFTYENNRYVLNIPTGSKLANCRVENKDFSNPQSNVGTTKRNPTS